MPRVGGVKSCEATASGAESRPDDVDAIVTAWQRERPDLDVDPLHVLSRVTRLARRLDQARAQAFAAHHLEPWEFDVLSALRRVGPPYQLSPGQLIEETLVTSGTMTNRVDRLQQRGLVARRPSPRDRRGVIVRLTAAGRRSVDGALETLLAHEHETLGALSPTDRATLTNLLRRLHPHLEP